MKVILRKGGPFPGRPPIALALSVAVVAALSCGAAAAAEDAPEVAPKAAAPKPKPATRALRLSDWVLNNPGGPDAYPMGLVLRLPEEVPAQLALKLELVSDLADDAPRGHADAASRKRLREWVAGLPVTGRVPVANADGRWLQMNAAYDPVMTSGSSVVLPRRPRTVTVITTTGEACRVMHETGSEAGAYVRACRRGGGAPVDWAWIAQPDGRVQRFGIAAWNREKQIEPAVGAWIWAPGRDSGWSDAFSERLIRFFATQGPAPDAPPDRSPGDGAAPVPQAGADDPQNARGATGGAGEGMLLGGGMTLALSETFLTQGGPDSPRTPLPNVPEPLALRVEERTQRPTRSLEVSSSDWGTVGLLQTPTARMREAGTVTAHYSRVQPYGRGNVIFQPFDWMEAGFRYTAISNRLYGPADFSGDQTDKDKSIDAKFRVWRESAYIPEIAIGLRDIGGTGLFGGEFVVGSKRFGDFDLSLGLGWGYAGGRGDIRNPLSIFSSKFDTRESESDLGGNLTFKRYFRGPTALFGGVQYHTPWDPLTVKVEYDGNNYQNEPQQNHQKQSSAINVALNYRLFTNLDLTVGLERGNKLMFGVALYPNLAKMSQPKLSDPQPVPVRDARPAKPPDWSQTAREFRRQTDWTVESIERRDNDVRVVIDNAASPYWRNKVDRGAAVLHRDAPSDVDRFTLTYRQHGVEVAEHVVDREAWARERTQPVPPSQRYDSVVARSPDAQDSGEAVHQGQRSAFDHSMRLQYSHILGGPDAFVLWQLGLIQSARYRFRDDTWVQATGRLRIADNYDKFQFTGNSNLPRVRTYQREYATTSRVTLPNAQLTHVGRAGSNHFYSAYGGYLEEMFGGVGGEWLYRPFASRFAFGADVNAVKQRDFDQHFGFMDYQTVTGHATMYWDTGWNDVLATVHVGRYLAKDYGATLSVQKVFRNGVVMGAFATKTNVSAEEFGEGSFDKGIFLSIPFDALFTRSSRGSMYTLWRPIQRDGGAMLARAVTLYPMTGARGDRTLWQQPAPLPDEIVRAVDRRVENLPERPAIEPYTRVTPKAPAEQWERGTSIDRQRLTGALYSQGFRNIDVQYDGSRRLTLEVTHENLQPLSRAIGRAARTALLHAPIETRGISVTLTEGTTKQVRYDFFDAQRLQQYFAGTLSAAELAPFVQIEWLNPAARVREPFAQLDDLEPTVTTRLLPDVVPETFSFNRVTNDFKAAGQTVSKMSWSGAAAFGLGATLAASLADTRAYRQARDHAGNSGLDNFVKFGDALPWVGAGVAGLLALDGSDPRRSRTGYAALEAGATAAVAATGLKYVVGRARPYTELGNKKFNMFTSDDAYGAFPSRHTAVAWALATPFALEYHMPALYGVAALTNLARIGSREHWVSDTVAGTLIGYGIGRVFWQSSRDQGKRDPKITFDGSSVNFLWDW